MPHIVQDIHSTILKNGFYFVKSKHLQMSRERAEQFYEEHKGKFFLNRLVNFMSSGPIWTHVLAREDAIAEWRRIMGPTKVLKTIYEAPHTIRGQYGLTDTRNCAHGSDSEATAQKEIQFFFPEFDIEKWKTDEEPLFQSGKVQFDEKSCEHMPVLQHGTSSQGGL
ncbi:hypothetical protein C0Q70_16865 [Pomacea canaliculata]|uniref:Nucleoside diphosphate kinase n=2 Tax=Pomacea canaliculata TaxID=400727 RepID=A0A2T7NR18_POMCA|nr:hypothetical protein C0Q70_16865 [Pomacea canaliculata]